MYRSYKYFYILCDPAPRLHMSTHSCVLPEDLQYEQVSARTPGQVDNSALFYRCSQVLQRLFIPYRIRKLIGYARLIIYILLLLLLLLLLLPKKEMYIFNFCLDKNSLCFFNAYKLPTGYRTICRYKTVCSYRSCHSFGWKKKFLTGPTLKINFR